MKFTRLILDLRHAGERPGAQQRTPTCLSKAEIIREFALPLGTIAIVQISLLFAATLIVARSVFASEIREVSIRTSERPGDELYHRDYIAAIAADLVVEQHPESAKQRRVIVDLYAPRAEIRGRLLKHTPIGSSLEYVVEFISKQLERSEDVSAITVRPANDASRPHAAKTIRVYLGQYYKHLGAFFLTAPMMVHEEVTAQWWFDRHDRLIDIVVDKQAGVY